MPSIRRPNLSEQGLLLAYTLGLTAVTVARPTASYKALDLGASAFELGLVGGAYGLLGLLLAIPIGRSVDRLGHRRFLVGGLLAILGAVLLERAAATLPALMLGQAVLGLGQVSVAVALQTQTANAPPPPSREERFARLSAGASVAALLGPAVAGASIGVTPGGIERDAGLALTYALAALIGLGAVVAAVVATRGTVAVQRTGVHRPPASIGALLREPGAVASLAASVAVAATGDLLVAYLPLIGERQGLAPAFVGAMLSLRAFAGLVSRLVLRPMLRTLGRRRVLVSMLALAALGSGGTALADVDWALVPLMIALGFGLGVGGPMTQSWAANAAAEHARGSALALRVVANRLAQVVVPTAVGGLAVSLGPAIVFVAAAAGLLASSVLVQRADMSGVEELPV